MKIVAIDFETTDFGADSACALGIVSIEDGKITRSEARLIRPPRENSSSPISTASPGTT